MSFLDADYVYTPNVAMKNKDEDPIALYLIVRESLDMGAGKMVAAGGHIVEKIMDKYWRFELYCAVENALPPPEKPATPNLKNIERAILVRNWKKTGGRKITLKADDKEWVKLKEEFGEDLFVVQDAGLSEVPEGSETCCGVWPMHKSKRPKILTRLQAQE
jgi:peptidyl-tRNA hydrolase